MPQVLDAPEAVRSRDAEVVRIKHRVAPFGYQLLLDLYDCKAGACDDLSLCYEFLEIGRAHV